MHLRLTVVVADRTQGLEVDVDIPSSSTASALATALARHLDLPATMAETLSVAGRAVAPDAPCGREPLVDGAVVMVGPPPRSRGTARQRRRSPVTLVVTHGPDAGHRLPLAIGTSTLGRSRDTDLPLDDPQLSRVHAELVVTADAVSVRDLGSANGTRLNGALVGASAQVVQLGDELGLGTSLVSVDVASDFASGPVAGNAGAVPRGGSANWKVPDPVSITVAAAPLPPPPPRVPWVAILVPLPVAAVLAWVVSPTLLAFALMSPVMMVGTTVNDRVTTKRRYAADLAQHHRDADVARARADELARSQAHALREAFPGPAQVLRMAQDRAERLWDGTADDALTVSLGLCSRASAVTVTEPGTEGRPRSVPMARVPCLVDLASAGTLSICGPRERVVPAARALVGQLAVRNPPGALEILVVGPDERTVHDWAWVDRLPHQRLPDGTRRPGGAVLSVDPHGTREALTALRHLSRACVPAPDASTGRTDPVLLLVLDGTSGLQGLPGLVDVLDPVPGSRLVTIAVSSGSDLPAGRHPLVEVTGSGRATLQQSPEEDAMTVTIDGVGPWWADRLSRALSPRRGGTGFTTAPGLPRTVTLGELVPPSLRAPRGIADHWLVHPNHTAVPLGRTATGPWLLDLARDGPHLLVAGTTGSGKSELLRSLVLSLALHNRPEHLSFVLVDYKGGAAFAECAALPHTAGLMTDLDAHLAERALVSLRAELRRRERLFRAAGVVDIDAYQETQAARTTAVARLVIVVDEFRALAQEVPRFVDGLVHVASLGRSLGVHLVLATQRPAGAVTADMRANVNLRVALRVRDRPDSDDVVDSPVAAGLALQTPGRAYVRSGAEPLQLVQVAHPSGWSESTTEGPVVRQVRFGSSGPGAPGRTGTTSRITPSTGEVRAMVEAIAQAAHLAQAHSSPVAWHPPLPDVIAAADEAAVDEAAVDEVVGERLAAVVAVADRPELQSQPPLVMDLGAGTHWAFIGSAGSGRTTALLTVAHAFAARLDPRRLHLHAISEGSLRELERLPHCGVHASSQDRPRLDRFFARVEAELASRRRVLSQHGFRSMGQWWASAGHVASAPPALLLLVDDWHLLAQPSHEPTGHRAAERLVALMRAGQGLGLVAAVAGDRSLVLGATGNVLTDRVVLRFADPTDAVLAGLKPAWVPGHQPPGRGVLADGTHIQVMLPPPGSPTGRMPAGRAALADGGSLALRVDTLPGVVPEVQLPVRRKNDGYLLGVGGDLAQPLGLTPEGDGRRWLVCGGPGSGVSTTLLLLARQLLDSGRHVVVVSGRAGPLDLLRSDPRLALWVRAGDPAPLVALHGRLPSLAVVVDAAEELMDAPVEPVLRELVRLADRDEALVVCGARGGALTTLFTGLAADVARCRTGVLLGPASQTEARALGVQVVEDPQAPPGRGYLLRKGTGTRLQVALPDV